jgi:hypothetical protein
MSMGELAWFKSSYSGSEGDSCVEVALSWSKSSYSSGSQGDCVEVATCPEAIHVRDSKDKQGPHFTFSAQEWTHFVAFARAQR